MQLCLFSGLWSPGVLPVLRFTTPFSPHITVPTFPFSFQPQKRGMRVQRTE